jgi:hypothetical protein
MAVATRNGRRQLRARSSSKLLRTVSKETLPMSRKLSSGGSSSRSRSSLISRNDGLRETMGLSVGVAEGGSSARRVALLRAGGGDKGMRAMILVRSPGVNKGASSVVGELAPEDVAGRVRCRGGCGSPCRAPRDWEGRERMACSREVTPI